jgi:hypothetical protein
MLGEGLETFVGVVETGVFPVSEEGRLIELPVVGAVV